MRTVVWTGSRGWEDAGIVIRTVESLRKPFRSIIGDARGLDSIVWNVLTRFSLPRLRFDADWEQYGKRAGHVRNDLMLRELQRIDPDGFLLAAWDGSSTGTKSMMDKAEKLGIQVWRIGGLM